MHSIVSEPGKDRRRSALPERLRRKPLVMLFVAALAAALSLHASAVSITLLSGDVNGDNAINYFDLSEIWDWWGESGSFPTVPDLNGDGIVDDFDELICGENQDNTGSTALTGVVVPDFGDYQIPVAVGVGNWPASPSSFTLCVRAKKNGVLFEHRQSITSGSVTVNLRVPWAGTYDVEAWIDGTANRWLRAGSSASSAWSP
jgi:hypothetical protein